MEVGVGAVVVGDDSGLVLLVAVCYVPALAQLEMVQYCRGEARALVAG